MKNLTITLLTITCFNSYSSESCTNYSKMSTKIIENIESQKNQDQKINELEFNKNIGQCSNQTCFQQAREQFTFNSFDILTKEKNALLEAYQQLAKNCID